LLMKSVGFGPPGTPIILVSGAALCALRSRVAAKSAKLATPSISQVILIERRPAPRTKASSVIGTPNFRSYRPALRPATWKASEVGSEIFIGIDEAGWISPPVGLKKIIDCIF
jgi:hypothetical protein